MTKYHINKNGRPSECHAESGTCPLGGATGLSNHFDSEAEAQNFADEIYGDSFIESDKTLAMRYNIYSYSIAENDGKLFYSKIKGATNPTPDVSLKNDQIYYRQSGELVDKNTLQDNYNLQEEIKQVDPKTNLSSHIRRYIAKNDSGKEIIHIQDSQVNNYGTYIFNESAYDDLLKLQVESSNHEYFAFTANNNARINTTPLNTDKDYWKACGHNDNSQLKLSHGSISNIESDIED